MVFVSDETMALFKMQADLIDAKVEVAVNRTIAQVVEQIINLRQEMHERFTKVDERFAKMEERFSKVEERLSKVESRLSVVESRLSSVESALGLRTQVRAEIRNRFYDYAFKAGWLVLGSTLMYLIVNLNNIFHLS